jgi:hypothetical protein
MMMFELAGEGIEYDWAAAKQWYRRQNLWRSEQKTSFENWSSIYGSVMIM